MIYPKFLKNNDTIGICAPSNGCVDELSIKSLENIVYNFEKIGFKIQETDSVRQSHKGRSNNALNRALELISLFENKNINGIICYSGGDFLLEILPYVDFNKIKNNPKWIQGFSDPTGILFTITTMLDIATLYTNNFATFDMKIWHKSLKNNIEILKGNIIEQNSFAKYQENRIESNEGYNLDTKVKWKNLKNEEKIVLEGRIIGGCIDILVNLIGTKYDNVKHFIEKYKNDGIIWYFDNCELTSEDLIRSLWQLKEAGWFKYVKGIVFGRSMTNSSYYNISFSDAVEEATKDLNVPIIIDVDIGHKPPRMTIINGALVKIVSENNKGKINFELK